MPDKKITISLVWFDDGGAEQAMDYVGATQDTPDEEIKKQFDTMLFGMRHMLRRERGQLEAHWANLVKAEAK